MHIVIYNFCKINSIHELCQRRKIKLEAEKAILVNNEVPYDSVQGLRLWNILYDGLVVSAKEE